MKPGKLLALMEGIIDGSFGIGTVDFIIEETLKGRESDEIMFDVVKKKAGKDAKNEPK